MNLGKPIGAPRMALTPDESVVGSFVVELGDGVTECDEAGNRYLRPKVGDHVRFGFEQDGRFVLLLDMPMADVLELIREAPVPLRGITS